MKDRFYRVLNSWHWVPLVVLGLVLLAIGGLPWLFWGVFLRVVVGLHCTWLVNSATHLWGKRRFQTGDDSKNNWWVALVTFGEGWHNNHHAYPASARHGFAWRELDLTWLQIRAARQAGSGLEHPCADRRPDCRQGAVARRRRLIRRPLARIFIRLLNSVQAASCLPRTFRLPGPGTRTARAPLEASEHGDVPGTVTPPGSGWRRPLGAIAIGYTEGGFIADGIIDRSERSKDVESPGTFTQGCRNDTR